MKNLILLLTLTAILSGCQKAANNGPMPTLLLLKVDYLTRRFEGGKAFQFTAGVAGIDSMPIGVIYKSPGDFGNITLTYAPTGDTVFDGGIIWMGKGVLRYPVFTPTNQFNYINTSVPVPDSSAVQNIFPQIYMSHFPDSTVKQTWSGISNLDLVQKMIAKDAKKGLFLYTPSVGVGNPADWDYIWMLYINPAG